MAHRQNLNRIFTFVVGCVFVYFAWNFWQGATLFAPAVAPTPDPESGMVSVGAAGRADFMLSILNLLATLVSGIGATVLTVVLGGISLISSTILPLFGADDQPAPRGNLPAQGLPHPAVSTNSMEQSHAEDLVRLLAKACIDGKASLVCELADELHGSPFMPRQSKGGGNE